MSENSSIKDTLYSKINAIGQETIHKLLLEKKYSELFELTYTKALQSINTKIDEIEKMGILAERFTHYLFTEMLIPSQRKISYENIELDMIVPNLVELKKNSDNSILIFFVKSSNNNIIKQRIQAVKKSQKTDKNIWVISKDEINISQRVYRIEKESFSRFLDDIQNFTELKNIACSFVVSGPRLPLPIIRLSSSRLGVTSAAVPVKKASSAQYTSSLVIRFSMTGISISPANSIIEARVIPSKQEVMSGVYSLLFLIIKIFSPDPSAT